MLSFVKFLPIIMTVQIVKISVIILLIAKAPIFLKTAALSATTINLVFAAAALIVQVLKQVPQCPTILPSELSRNSVKTAAAKSFIIGAVTLNILQQPSLIKQQLMNEIVPEIMAQPPALPDMNPSTANVLRRPAAVLT